ncbi:MAG: FxsA family protein, partial [Candidatus Bipolaricaulia bacterium]
MSLRLIFLFTALPLIEIYLLIRVGNAIGYLLTALVVVGTGVVGALLARREGLSVLRR